jgi:hypothetical protein
MIQVPQFMEDSLIENRDEWGTLFFVSTRAAQGRAYSH